MKKSILLVAALFSLAVMITSCKETKKEEVKSENHDDHDHDKDEMSSNDVYQCPMDCEKGKTYDKEGSCPVCKMDLKKKKEANNDSVHVDGCKCKEKGECTCEGEKCECLEEIASNMMDCDKCEPGKCTCKA
jgi:hypothetical protein